MFSRELILSQFTQGHIHQDVYSLIFFSISNFPQSQGFGVDLYCRPPGQVPVVFNSLISNVSEIYLQWSLASCVDRGSMLHKGGQSLRLRKEVVWKPLRERVPQGSCPVPLSCRLESYRGGKSLRKGRKLQLSSTGSWPEQIQATSARGWTTLTQRTTLIDNWTKEHTAKKGAQNFKP